MNKYCKQMLTLVVLGYVAISIWAAFAGISAARAIFMAPAMLSFHVFSFLLILLTIFTMRPFKNPIAIIYIGVCLLFLGAVSSVEIVFVSYGVILVGVIWSCVCSFLKLRSDRGN